MNKNYPSLSANLGFLWTEHSLPDAIHRAAEAGFGAVEAHFPYAYASGDVKAALQSTGLPMLGINTQRGNVEAGDNGLAAIPGREDEARGFIDEAINYAAAINCRNVHIMAGFSSRDARAEFTFRENLNYACELAGVHDIIILIEPLNHYDAPNYHLNTIDDAIRTVDAVGRDNLKIMFDCYHVQIMQGDLTRRLRQSLPYIGHIQFASVPERQEPDRGEINYANLFAAIFEMGWTGYLGAEYKPHSETNAGLGWMSELMSS